MPNPSPDRLQAHLLEPPLPKAALLKSHLLAELTTGRWKPGAAMPSESRLADAFSVSRPTVRHALAALERDGLISRVPGKGTFVRERTAAQASHGVKTFALVLRDTKMVGRSLLSGLVMGAKALHHQVVIHDTENTIGEQANVILQLMQARVAGVAILPVYVPETPAYQILQLQERGIPVVFCHRGVEGVRAPIVALDLARTGRLMAEALLEHGHRRLAIFAEDDTKVNNALTEGFCNRAECAGGHVPREFRWHGRLRGAPCIADQEEDIREALAAMFRNANPPTAVATTWDQLGEMVYLSLSDMGLQVPEEVSVIGLGDKAHESAIGRRLTSVVVDEAQVGRRAVELLHRMRHDGRLLESDEWIVAPLGLGTGETLGPAPLHSIAGHMGERQM